MVDCFLMLMIAGGGDEVKGIKKGIMELADQRLQGHADAVGARLLDRLCELAGRHELIGDVRGSGLFLGVQLVGDRELRTAAGDVAERVVEAVRRRGVLISRDGPYHDVLMIKPPMVLSVADADRFVIALDDALAEMGGTGPV